MIRPAGGSARPTRRCANHGAHRSSPAAAAHKKLLHADERETDRVQQARAAYQAESAALDAPRFTCSAEAGVTLRCTAQAWTREALEHAIAKALATITAADAHSWFHHCGYALQ